MQKTVFVVDDNDTNLTVAEEALEKYYRVVALPSAAKMFKALEKFEPDLILLDVEMPEMDGYTVISILKESESTKDIPVIFVTAMTDTKDELKGLDLGAVDYISKPFSRRLLLKRVELHLKLKQYRSDLEKMAEEALAASKAKGDFLSTMSHEMRTPMNAIIGMTAIGRKAEDIEGKNYAFNRISDASSHLLGVINDVLDMSKIEANKLELSPVAFDFDKMLQKVATVVNFRIEEKQQVFTIDTDPNMPLHLIGDDQRLAQVITNLLSNAVKFTPNGGDIRLEASLINETDDNCELCISVKDSGIGISAEQQSKLFREFGQAESSTSRKFGGTGLGLTISKRIVELMGGKIWIESELGKGAKFIFTINVLRDRDGGKTEPDEKPAEQTAGMFADRRMLLAEDIDINREILIMLLGDTGLIIDCAENGKEALDMVTANPDLYDIIFMDVQMPEMDGHEATRQIRKLPAVTERSRPLPIIALTGNVFKDDIEACTAAGMDSHLGKPLDIDKVFEVLGRHLKERQA